MWGPNAAGKTSLLEAIVLLGWGRSHRTSSDGELIRWGHDVARVEGRVGDEVLEVAVTRSGADGLGGRKRIRVNGVGRRAGALGRSLRIVLFAPEEMLLVVGAPALRRGAVDTLAAARSPMYAEDLAGYGRALQQRNSLLRAIREETATRDQLHFWDGTLLDTGARIVERRLGLLEELAAPLAAAHREIAPEEAAAGGLALRYVTNAPMHAGESPRDALARRLAETAEKEIWNGATLVGPHRDDIAFELGGRDLGGFASRGQQRTAILAFKLAELDPDRRSHLVRRIAGLPQAFVTTTTLEDLDPALRDAATAWEVRAEADGAALLGPKGGA